MSVSRRAIGAILGITSAAFLAPPIGVALLGPLGFTAAGVAAGSFAALYQSVVYGAWTGGIFASLMSAGATASAPAAGTVAVGVASGVGALWARFG